MKRARSRWLAAALLVAAVVTAASVASAATRTSKAVTLTFWQTMNDSNAPTAEKLRAASALHSFRE